jgi:hypothetical protein
VNDNTEQNSKRDEGSPTLRVLPPERRPRGRTVCEQCPHAVWFSTNQEVKAYCRVMYLVSWSAKEPNEIKLCDGLFLGSEDSDAGE